ncbi:MAG: hypothetical protein JXQ85_15845 [Cognatishimia sp.]|uniref:hypothetical protein n=1 Tax=Cognatishimia sp. TaxID=2211648 RepID=UPI003B8CE64D
MTFFSKTTVLLLSTANMYVLAGDILQTSVEAVNGELKAQAATLLAQISFPGSLFETARTWSLTVLQSLT